MNRGKKMPNKVTVGMRMPEDMRDEIRRRARLDCRTFSGEIEMLIARGLLACMREEAPPHDTMIAPEGGADNGV